MKKRILTALMTAAIAVSSIAVPSVFASENNFRDVSADAWYADAVEYVNTNGIMSGVSSSAFNPNGNMTRAMFAAVLYRMAGSPSVSGNSDFKDVPLESYYANAAAWAEENNIVSGYGNGLFGSNDNISRTDIAVILYRYANSPSVEESETFEDEASIPQYALSAVKWARNKDIINGIGGNIFNPMGNATRAQTAVVIRNYISANDESTIAKTQAGLVQGTNENGIYRYLGVPYAEAKERFVPVEKVTPWEGIKMAVSYGPMSPQGSISGLGDAGEQNGTDNNSQNLNIWTPGINDGKKRPVMVWLHGGGFSTGTANEEGYDGENLSREGDVVVVGINHRLNTFGFLDLSAYGDKYKYSANVGIMDIVDALKWIRENIDEFGGDPDNVTVFGQSGGGAKVLALMSSPYAKGLFDKGIVQSGATETMGVVFNSQEASTRLTENILKRLNITADNIEDIQNVPIDELQSAATEALAETGEELKLPAALGGGYSMDWEPVVDGDFLPTNPVTDESFAEAGKDIPLLIGSNLNEWSGYFKVDPITPTAELTEALRSAYPDKLSLTAEEVDTTTIRLPLLKIMSHKADQKGANVYAYVFTYGNSYHGAEIPYVFDNITNGTEEEQKLAEQISTAWINFAKTGTPSADGLPTWENYTRENGATMLLDTKSELVHNHDENLMNILFPDYKY